MPEYSLEQDHANIKKQIKEWEIKIDRIIREYPTPELPEEVAYTLENLSHEMMAINI